jgi:hypothetical protein
LRINQIAKFGAELVETTLDIVWRQLVELFQDVWDEMATLATRAEDQERFVGEPRGPD